LNGARRMTSLKEDLYIMGGQRANLVME
jgi:hypothetical protein